MDSSMIWNLVDDSTASAEDLAEKCRSETVDVDVNVVGMIDGVLDALELCRR